MKRLPLGVRNNECYYDFIDDYEIINADCEHRYHRSLKDILEDKTIDWPKFTAMISNLGPTSSLVHVVSIRSEKDPVKIRKFNSYERKIYLDWKKTMNWKKSKQMLLSMH